MEGRASPPDPGRSLVTAAADRAKRREPSAATESAAGLDVLRSEPFDALPDPVMVADPAGTYVDVNVAALDLFGYTRDDFIGMRVDDLGAEGAEVSRRRLEQLIRNGFWRGPVGLRHADGSTIRVFLTASVVQMDDGPRYVAVLR